MRLKTKYSVRRGLALDNKGFWFLFKMNDNNKWEALEVGTKRHCRALMATLKRQEFLSSTFDVRESQRRELREGAE